MKILICSCGFNSFSEKRVDVFQFDQARALADRGHDVRIATLDMRSFRRWRSPFSACYEQGGLKVFTVNSYCGRMPAWVINPLGKRAAKKALKLACRDGWKPDVMHAHFTDMGYFFCDVAKELGVPYVITEHSSAIKEETLDGTVRIQAEYAYCRADALLAVGRDLASHMERKFAVKPTVVPNIVDLTLFSAARRIERGKDEPFVFTAAANLNYGKGMDVLLKAFAALGRDNVRLNILGGGEEMGALCELAKTLGVSDVVSFSGIYKREQFRDVLERTDCFALASRGETFGVVYIEALAAGVPVIGTRCGGPEDFVTDELGILVDVDNVTALTDAMEYMLTGAQRYDADTLKKRVSDEFSPERIAERLEEIYLTLTEQCADT